MQMMCVLLCSAWDFNKGIIGDTLQVPGWKHVAHHENAVKNHPLKAFPGMSSPPAISQSDFALFAQAEGLSKRLGHEVC